MLRVVISEYVACCNIRICCAL